MVGAEDDPTAGVGRFLRRLGLLLSAVFVGALVGFVLVDRRGTWQVDPVAGSAAMATLFAGSPVAIALAAGCRVGRRAFAALAAVVGALMLWTVLSFGASERATASLVFLLWWTPGLLIAGVVVWLSHRGG